MNVLLLRPYRKNLTTQGLIYLAGREQAVTIKNISMSGVLAQLNEEACQYNIKDIFNTLLSSSIIDLYLPEMRMAGEAQVTRVDFHDDHILIALEFKNITHGASDELYKRKVYRKNLPGPGQILFNGRYREFNAVNVSVEGIMIRLEHEIHVEPGIITKFKFERLNLEGEAKVRWTEHIRSGETLIGLQYVHMEKSSIKGIPEFVWPLTA